MHQLLGMGLWLVFLTVGANFSFASDSGCTEWTKVAGQRCAFADKSSDFNGYRWERTCSYDLECKNRKDEHGPCHATKICLLKSQNPNEMTSPCTDWVPRRDVECIDGRMSWIRACQMSGIGYPDSTCSNSYPEEP